MSPARYGVGVLSYSWVAGREHLINIEWAEFDGDQDTQMNLN